MTMVEKQDASPTVPAQATFCLYHRYYNPLVTAKPMGKPRVKRQIQPTMRPKEHMAKANVY